MNRFHRTLLLASALASASCVPINHNETDQPLPVDSGVDPVIDTFTGKTIASGQASPNSIVSDGHRIFWLNFGTPDGLNNLNNGSVQQYDPVTETVSTLVENLKKPTSLKLAGETLFWVENENLVMSMRKAGDTSPVQITSAIGQIYGLSASSDRVAWIERLDDTEDGLYSSDHVGADLQTIHRAPYSSMSQTGIDGNEIYWLTGSETFLRGPLDGSGTPIEIDIGLSFSPIVLQFALDGGYMYWGGENGADTMVVGRTELATGVAENLRFVRDSQASLTGFAILPSRLLLGFDTWATRTGQIEIVSKTPNEEFETLGDGLQAVSSITAIDGTAYWVERRRYDTPDGVVRSQPLP